MKTFTLERGTTLYRGTQFSRESHPTGPAWFAPERETAKSYAEQQYTPRPGQTKEHAPGTRKYRVTRSVKLPDIPRADLEKLLATLGEKAGLGDRVGIYEWLEAHGDTSGTYWNLDQGFTWDDEEPPTAPPGFIEHRITGIRPLLAYLCKALPSFHGYRSRWSDGLVEIVLCDPKAVLKSRARQPVPRHKLREREEKERKWLERQEEARRQREEEKRKKKEQEEREFIRHMLLQELSGHGAAWQGIGWSDPEWREALKNWRKYVTPREIEEYARKHKQWGGPPGLPGGGPARLRRRMAARVAARWLASDEQRDG